MPAYDREVMTVPVGVVSLPFQLVDAPAIHERHPPKIQNDVTEAVNVKVEHVERLTNLCDCGDIEFAEKLDEGGTAVRLQLYTERARHSS